MFDFLKFDAGNKVKTVTMIAEKQKTMKENTGGRDKVRNGNGKNEKRKDMRTFRNRTNETWKQNVQEERIQLKKNKRRTKANVQHMHITDLEQEN